MENKKTPSQSWNDHKDFPTFSACVDTDFLQYEEPDTARDINFGVWAN